MDCAPARKSGTILRMLSSIKVRFDRSYPTFAVYTPSLTRRTLGYQVIAPDLIGHGMAPASKDYSIKAMANALLPLLSSSPPFDLVVGHSLGTLVVLFLLPDLRFAWRGRVVLIDPPLEIGTGEPLEMTRKACVDQVLDIKSVQEYMTQMNWTEADAVWRILGLQLCKPEMINTFFDVSLLFKLLRRSFTMILSRIAQHECPLVFHTHSSRFFVIFRNGDTRCRPSSWGPFYAL
jgi:Alpha/beta hydrolase family